MATSVIEQERVRTLNDSEPNDDGSYVLYWMQASMRSQHNPALEHSVRLANDLRVPLVVMVVVIDNYPDASPRHFAFMLGGMGQALRSIHRRGIATVVRRSADPVEVVLDLAEDAAAIVLDRGYLRHQRSWRKDIASQAERRVICVEGDVVVPIDLVSDKQETAARTIRSKINERRDDFIVELTTTAIDVTRSLSIASDLSLDDFDDIDALLGRLGLDDSDAPQPVDWIASGERAAQARLDDFLDRAGDYGDDRNEYHSKVTSMMSPYLHFGQISPVDIAKQIVDRLGSDAEEYLEELIVRRELAMNYVEHCADYDTFAGLPAWARDSLEAHEDDEREHVYTASELENGETDDDVWNAIMDEIRERGWVHNQLRMYWGKQFVRWTNTPRHAHRTLLELNNRWFLDGRDPSSYANVGWCFGLHDQGFKERDVSGKLRPFTTAALKRKDDLEAWLADRIEEGQA